MPLATGTNQVFRLYTDAYMSKSADPVSVWLCPHAAPASESKCTQISPAYVARTPPSRCRPRTTIPPPNAYIDEEWSFVELGPDMLDGMSKVVVQVHPYHRLNPRWHFIVADLMPSRDAHLDIDAGQFSIAWRGAHIPLSDGFVSDVRLPALDTSLLSYFVDFSATSFPASCEGVAAFAPLLRQSISPTLESKYFPGIGRHGPILLHAHGPKAPFIPYRPLEHEPVTRGMRLQIWVDNAAASNSDTVVIRIDWYSTLAKIAIRYRGVILAFPLGLIFIIKGRQRGSNGTTNFGGALSSVAGRYVAPLAVGLAIFSQAQAALSYRTGSEAFTHSRPTIADDALLGIGGGMLAFLPALFLLLATGLLAVLHILLAALINLSALVWIRLGWRSESRNGPRSYLRARAFSLFALIGFVIFFAPYQFAFLVVCIIHITTTVRAKVACIHLGRRYSAVKAAAHEAADRQYDQCYNGLLALLMLLPINAPILAVWTRNMLAGWWAPFSSDHNALAIIGFLLWVENTHERVEGHTRDKDASSTSDTPPAELSKKQLVCANVEKFLAYGTGGVALLAGVRRTYLVFACANVFFAWSAVTRALLSESRLGRGTKEIKG